MDYYNPNTFNFYSTPSNPQGFDAYPSQGQTPAVEEFNNYVQSHEIPTSNWSTVTLPGSAAGSWIDHCPPAGNYESVAPATSYATGIDNWRQPAYTHNNWSEIEQAQPEYPDYSSREATSLAITATQETSFTTPGPSSIPPDYLGGSHCGPSMAAFGWADVEVGPSFHNPIPQPNVQATYQHSSGPDRAELVPPGRFEPYGMPRTWANEYTNAEAGPSTLVQPLAPYFQPPTSQPPGWIPETTADAENSHSTTEGEEAQVPEQTRAPYGLGPPRPDRERQRGNICRLRNWVYRYNGHQRFPTTIEALAEAAEIIRMLRSRKYQSPRLHLRGGRQAQVQRVWENQERSLFQDLSQYYWLPQGKRSWSRPSLMKKVLEDLERLDVPP